MTRKLAGVHNVLYEYQKRNGSAQLDRGWQLAGCGSGDLGEVASNALSQPALRTRAFFNEKVMVKGWFGDDRASADIGLAEKVVVFIDDLDRLMPKRTVELLEAMKILLDIDRCVYVNACDYSVAAAGGQVRSTTRWLQSPRRRSGYSTVSGSFCGITR